ncbi:hypothetical protein [Flavobacterium sp. UBA6135]|uniref:hypothetical protein n=1 Tax=Flavobacterium sp. UBA6135 TaxID=1946553 RepID=UPI0025C167E8|nr:hypothetical protein [Flavobacterium sp. UBA6135]
MKQLILTLFLIGYIFPVIAQMNRGTNGSGGLNDMSRYSKRDTQNEKKDPVVETMKYLKEELSLDNFQEAAIKSYLLENILESEKVIATSLNQEEKKLKFEELKNKFDLNTKSILNPDQIEIYNIISQYSKKNEKAKMKKKKKNN